MKVLVTGGNGQLAYDVKRSLEASHLDYKAIDYGDADITSEEEIKRVILDYRPDAIIHCAAYTAVDRAEEEREKAYAINVLGTRYIAQAAKEIEAKLVYISTDYIFEGVGDHFYEVEDEAHPINWYGETKYQGELEVQKCMSDYFIVRISWVCGVQGQNFVKTMMKLGAQRASLNVVSDQVGSPTFTADAAPLLVEMIQTNRYGVYHLTNEGVCSWAEFAQEIFKIAGLQCEVNFITSEEYPTVAKRPYNSRMSKGSLSLNGFRTLQDWKLGLVNLVNSIKEK